MIYNRGITLLPDKVRGLNMNPKKIVKRKAFEDLFELDPGIRYAIQADMEVEGFDPAHPLILAEGPWTTVPVLLDGHIRLAAALGAGIKDVPTICKVYKTEKDAIIYAIHTQMDRRNLNEASLIELSSQFDLPISKPGPKRESIVELDQAEQIRSLFDTYPLGKPVEYLSQSLGISRNKAAKIRAVSQYATEHELQQIRAGTLTISAAYELYLAREATEERREKRWNGILQSICRRMITMLDSTYVRQPETIELLSNINQLIINPKPKPAPAQIEEEEAADILDTLG